MQFWLESALNWKMFPRYLFIYLFFDWSKIFTDLHLHGPAIFEKHDLSWFITISKQVWENLLKNTDKKLKKKNYTRLKKEKLACFKSDTDWQP